MEAVTEDIAAEAMQHMDAAEVSRALRGFGLNLLCRQVILLADSIASVLEMRVIRANDVYAIIAARAKGRGTRRQCGIPVVRHGPGCGRPQGRGGGMAHSATADRQTTRVALVLSAGS